ncbi:uncharacterized protein [Rutidosis leptorrhynchoides]|uniref:uncharacterized protein n=1 Tax=Rutidosis leptorrhynchoides TaxID=125765 RepID=UPI003A99BFDF
MASMFWEKMEDLKDAMLIVCLSRNSLNYCHVVPSELTTGGIHILEHQVNFISWYDVRNKTITMSRMPLTDLLYTTNYAVWSIPGYRLEGDYGKIESKQEEVKEYEVLVVNDECVFSFSFDILELIMKFCDDVDYFNFRATCKQLATLPVIRWSNITEIQQSLQTYSLVSPWSMVLDNDRGIITITDSMLGNKYFIRTSQDLVGDVQIHYSKNGWLLMSKNTSDLMFFNPFTSDIRKLPPVNISHVDEFCFSAGPTSPDCMVFGLGTDSACIHFVGREQSWAWRMKCPVHINYKRSILIDFVARF